MIGRPSVDRIPVYLGVIGEKTNSPSRSDGCDGWLPALLQP